MIIIIFEKHAFLTRTHSCSHVYSNIVAIDTGESKLYNGFIVGVSPSFLSPLFHRQERPRQCTLGGLDLPVPHVRDDSACTKENYCRWP